MIEKLMKWLGADAGQAKPSIDTKRAATALLLEIMAADQSWDDRERQKIFELLQDELGVSAEDCQTCLIMAEQDHADSNDLYRYTRVINDHYGEDEKFKLVILLWKVAYADGDLDRFEEHLIRKIADLIYVPHKDFIAAKLHAQRDLS